MLVYWSVSDMYPPWPSQKERIVFQPSIFRCELLVSGSVPSGERICVIPRWEVRKIIFFKSAGWEGICDRSRRVYIYIDIYIYIYMISLYLDIYLSIFSLREKHPQQNQVIYFSFCRVANPEGSFLFSTPCRNTAACRHWIFETGSFARGSLQLVSCGIFCEYRCIFIVEVACKLEKQIINS